MTTTEARAFFDRAAAIHRRNGDLDKAAAAEVLREYFTNPGFAKALGDHVWTINQETEQ